MFLRIFHISIIWFKNNFWICIFLFEYVYFVIYTITVIPLFFSPLHPPLWTSPPCSIPPTLSSCPWVIHISSLSSLFPIPFFYLSPSILCLPIMLLLPCTFPPPPFLPSPSPLKSLQSPFLWFCSCSSCSLSLCFCCFCFFHFFLFFLGTFVDSCEFIVILLFIFWSSFS